MTYNKLLEIYKNPAIKNGIIPEVESSVRKILSPRPLKDIQELTEISSSKFRYTGPGKWVKIIREAE